MDFRRLESGLAWLTLGLVAVYAPIETWMSLPYGLAHPLYLVDVAGMALLVFGAVHSLRARPRPAAGPLAAGWAWSAANGWRASSWRWLETKAGGELDHGPAEAALVYGGTLLAIVCFLLALGLASRRLESSG